MSQKVVNVVVDGSMLIFELTMIYVQMIKLGINWQKYELECLSMGKNLQYFRVYTFKSNPAENVFIFWAMNKICQKSQKWNTKGIDKKFNDSLLH